MGIYRSIGVAVPKNEPCPRPCPCLTEKSNAWCSGKRRDAELGDWSNLVRHGYAHGHGVWVKIGGIT